MRASFSRFGLASLVLWGAVAQTSCSSDPSVSLDVQVPTTLTGVVSYELAAFPGGKCSSLQPTLVGGLPLVGTAARSAFPAGGATVGLGKLAQGDYALAIVGRDQNCKVLATGCSDVALDGSKSVTLALSASTEGGAACGQDSSCVSARCVPKPVSEVPGCTMAVVAQGALDGAIASASVAVSGPAIVADDDGFRVGYRLIDPANGESNGISNSRYGYFTINNSGAVVERVEKPFRGGCDNVPLSDGLGFLRMNGKLLMATSVPYCRPGTTTLRQGDVELTDWTDKDAPKVFGLDPGGYTPTLATQNALTTFNNKLLVIKAEQARTSTDGNISWLAVDPSTGEALPGEQFFISPDIARSVEMVGSDKVLATLTQNTGQVYVRAHNALQSYLDLTKVREQVSTYSAVWGHLALKGKRAFLLRGLDQGASLTVHDPIGAATAPFAPSKPADPGVEYNIPLNSDGGPSGGGALTVHGSHVFALMAQAQQGDPILTLATFAGASTKLFQTHATYITQEMGAPTLNTMRDARVAVAASKSRVLVVWVASTSQNGLSTLKKGQAMGGYMQFACTDESP